jgi:hypothetical protein
MLPCIGAHRILDFSRTNWQATKPRIVANVRGILLGGSLSFGKQVEIRANHEPLNIDDVSPDEQEHRRALIVVDREERAGSPSELLAEVDRGLQLAL